MGDFYGASIAAEDVGITAGCNQAFCLALLALARAGEEVILPLPYYFNHQMWLDMQGITRAASAVPARARRRAGSGRCRGADRAEDAGHRAGDAQQPDRGDLPARASSPNSSIWRGAMVWRWCWTRPIAISCRRTGAPHGLFAEPGWRETLVQLYSFSKVFR